MKSLGIFDEYCIQIGLRGDKLWKIEKSSLGGRGIFAQCDIPSGNIVFVEPPLIIGPKSTAENLCVSCYRVQTLQKCPGQCGLTVCNATCANCSIHTTECKLFSKIIKTNVPVRMLLAAVAPLRAIQLKSWHEREVLYALERHSSIHHNKIVNLFQDILTVDDLDMVRICCEVFDAVAYEAPGLDGRNSLKGIYPLGGLLNHCCTPNTRHCFDSKGRMILTTSKNVKSGEELTTSYTCLTWGTEARRIHLWKTKKFCCFCQRCKDPSEFGANLMGLYCLRKKCSGVILPRQGFWSCGDCGARMKNCSVEVIQSALGSLLSSMSAENPKEVSKVLQKGRMVPACNQTAVEFKINLIKLYGNEPRFDWTGTELKSEDLSMKFLLCHEILNLFDVLRLGQLRLKGFILLELSSTIREMINRKMIAMHHDRECSVLLDEAAFILQNDITADNMLKRTRKHFEPITV